VKSKKLYCSILLFLVSAVLLTATDNTFALSIIRTMAESSDPNLKVEAVYSLEEKLIKGELNSEDEDEVLEILTLLASEGIINIKYDSLRIDNDHDHVRNEAVRVLGMTGNPAAVDSLVAVILNEPMTHVLSTAVISCGQLGMAHKKIGAAFYLILTGKKEAYRSDTLVYNTLLAIKMIKKSDDSLMVSGTLRDGVLHVANMESGFIRKTRKLAEEILADK
jgi:HEAT repeat protein